MRHLGLKLSAASALCLAVMPALAQPASTTFQNGSFDTGAAGLAHWQSHGDVRVLGTNPAAALTTASVDFTDDEPLPAGSANLSGVAAIDFFAAATLAGIPVEHLDIGGVALEGSAIRQDFQATGGGIVTVSFDWTLLTAELAAGGFSMPDFGFVALNGAVVRFATATGPSGAGRLQHTFIDAAHLLPLHAGATLYTPQAGGQVALVVGVVDIGDHLVTSELRIDSVSVSAVPEPEAFAMFAAGLGLIGWQLRRRKAQDDRTVA